MSESPDIPRPPEGQREIENIPTDDELNRMRLGIPGSYSTGKIATVVTELLAARAALGGHAVRVLPTSAAVGDRYILVTELIRGDNEWVGV